MAGSSLATNRTTANSAVEHRDDHNAIHKVVNLFDKDAVPATGQLLRWNGTVWLPVSWLDTLPANQLYSVPIATCIAAANRAAVLTRTDIRIAAYGPGDPAQLPSWFIDGYDYWDLIPSA